MKRIVLGLALIALCCLFLGCDEKGAAVEALSMDYPHGETRLLVQSNGDAYLFCGACPQYDKVRNGTFDIKDMLKQLRPRLHENTPREEWPDPEATAGMVSIMFADGEKRDYLIFNQHAFSQVLFDRARNNTVSKGPPPEEPKSDGNTDISD